MVECRREAGCLPGGGSVAGIASLLELAFVRIAMTVRAICERNPGIAHLTARIRSVTALAKDVAMFTGQGIARLGMIESLLADRRRFPIQGGVAARAVRAESALVRILMTGATTRREPKPGAVQILIWQEGTCLRGDVLRTVAHATTHPYMLTVEHVPRLRVIESLRRWIPPHHLKIDSIVVRMTFHASRAGGARPRKCGVKPPVLSYFRGNFAMALKTLKGRRPGGNFVALDAIGISVQALVSPGERPGGDLCVSRPCEQETENQCHRPSEKSKPP